MSAVRVTRVPVCEGCRRPAEVRVNGLFVCLRHADLASEAGENEVDDIVVEPEPEKE